MKVSKDEILQIKPGKTKIFICDSPLAARNGQALVLNYVKKYFLPKGVSNFTTSLEGNILSVTAVASSN